MMLHQFGARTDWLGIGPGCLRAKLSAEIYGAGAFATSFGQPGDFAMPQIMRIIVNGIHWAANVQIPETSKGVKTFHLAPKRVHKGNTGARARKR